MLCSSHAYPNMSDNTTRRRRSEYNKAEFEAVEGSEAVAGLDVQNFSRVNTPLLTLNQYSILGVRLEMLAGQNIYHHDAYKFIVQHIYFDELQHLPVLLKILVFLIV